MNNCIIMVSFSCWKRFIWMALFQLTWIGSVHWAVLWIMVEAAGVVPRLASLSLIDHRALYDCQTLQVDRLDRSSHHQPVVL